MTEKLASWACAERLGGRRFGQDTTLYKFEKIKRAKRAAQAAHPTVELIDLGVGEPDDMAFPEVVATLAREAGQWKNRTYTDNGIREFREAVQRYMQSLYGVTLDVDNQICHSIGSKSALALLPAAFINPGDVTIMTTPGYPILGTWTKYLGGDVVNLPLTRENHFFPQFERLTEAQLQRAKLLYLNYPNNPTGASATREFYDRAVAFARERGLLIVADSAYSSLDYRGQPLSILAAPGAVEAAIELHSMSKGFNMTGWRLGWVCGNELAVKAFAHVKDNADSGQFAAIQLAAVKALDNHAAITNKIGEKYDRRLSALTEMLRAVGFPAVKPDGSFFLYTDAPKGARDGKVFASAEDFSEWLIHTSLISTVPWDDVGHCVRFSATFIAPGIAEEQRVLGELKRRLSALALVF